MNTHNPNEPLKNYIKRFTATFIYVKDPNESFAIMTFRTGVANEHMHYTLYNDNITSMHEFISKAQAFVEAEEMRLNHIGQM